VGCGEVAVAGIKEVAAIVVVVGRLDVSMPPVTQVVFADIGRGMSKRGIKELGGTNEKVGS